MTTILILAGALLALWVLKPITRSLLALLFGKSIGKAALARQPDQIHLTPAGEGRFGNGIPDGIAAQMVHRGFEDVGNFTIPEMEGIVARLLAHPGESLYACIYVHPRTGVWFDYVSRYKDGTAATFTTCAPSGMQPRPGFAMEHAMGASPLGLLDRTLAERPRGALKPASAQNAVRDFEQAYAEHIAWLKGRGISRREVVRVATRKAA
jgi:hypothetical protein